MLRFGIGPLSLQRLSGDATPWEDVYADAVQLAMVAEEEGFDSFWLSEHHLSDDGYLSALLPLLAAIATRTDRIGLGTAAALAPLYHPLRLAEDANAVQILSSGRLILGLALGYRDEEFQALGVERGGRVERLVKAVEWLRSDRLQPRPARPVPVWLGGWSPAAMRRAAEMGDGIILPAGGLDAAAQAVHSIEAQRRDPVPYQLYLYGWISKDGGYDAIRPGLRHMRARYAEWYSASSYGSGGAAVGQRYAEAMDDPAALRRIGVAIVTGTPDDWLHQLAPYADLFRGREVHLSFRIAYPGMPGEMVRAAARLIGRDVIPALRRDN